MTRLSGEPILPQVTQDSYKWFKVLCITLSSQVAIKMLSLETSSCFVYELMHAEFNSELSGVFRV